MPFRAVVAVVVDGKRTLDDPLVSLLNFEPVFIVLVQTDCA